MAARLPHWLADLVVVQRLVVEEVEAQEGAHPLVQRLLEDERRRAAVLRSLRVGVQQSSVIGLFCLTVRRA